MTVTATKKKTTTKTLTRRTPEQIVADLHAKIADVQARTAAREVRQSLEGKAFLAAIKGVEKATRIAEGAGDKAMVAALEAARAPLVEHLEAMGVSRQQAQKPRLVRPKAQRAGD